VFVDDNAIRHHSMECNLNVPKVTSPLHMTFLPKVGVVRVGRIRHTDHMSRMPSSCRAAKVSQGLAPDYYSPKTSKGSGLGTGYIKHYITDETREPHKLDSHQKALTRGAGKHACSIAGHLDSDDFLELYVWNKVVFNKLPLLNLTAML
jgi:hypothetical protein